jgi:hypothetical protein
MSLTEQAFPPTSLVLPTTFLTQTISPAGEKKRNILFDGGKYKVYFIVSPQYYAVAQEYSSGGSFIPTGNRLTGWVRVD